MSRCLTILGDLCRRWWRRGLLVGVGLAITTAGVIAFCHYRVLGVAEGRCYDRLDAVPSGSVALVLGCSKYVAGHRPNRFFNTRIQAATELYRAGKVRALIVSGDNSTKSYDEPSDMKEALVAAGVPEAAIYCDYAGFRTFDSVIRAQKIFGQTQLVIVSQRFHNERAVYLAQKLGINASGYNAKAIATRSAPMTYAREWLARVAAVLDAEIWKAKPKFLGPEIKIAAATKP
ncbi:MAG: YdcF family protein [Verrucomicrobiaceae bacterium]|nr:YdcF family protein [Verrucomicrobiaceae bacterium]